MNENKFYKERDYIFRPLMILFLIIVVVFIAYPLYFVLIASFTDPTVVNTGKILLWPEKPFFGGYQRIFRYPPLWQSYWNTIVYTVVGTLVSLGITLPAAYSLSRRDLKFRRPTMFFFTFTMFFNGGIIPLFLVITRIGIYDTIWAMVLPLGLSVYNLIVCRTFFESNLPDELLEAAKIDGISDFGFFFRIALPLSKTIIAVMVLFYGTTMWNQFMNALMFMSTQDKMPLQVILRNLILINQASALTTSASEMIMRQKLAEQLKYAVIVASAIPPLVAYPFLQKHFTKGVMIGAVKG